MVTLADWRQTRDLPLCRSSALSFGRRPRGPLSLEQRRHMGRFGRREGQRLAGRPLAGSGTGYGGALTFPDLAKTPHGSALAASMRRDRALAAAALVAEAEGDEEEAAAQAAVAAAAAGPDGEEGVTPPPQLFDELGEPRERRRSGRRATLVGRCRTIVSRMRGWEVWTRRGSTYPFALSRA